MSKYEIDEDLRGRLRRNVRGDWSKMHHFVKSIHKNQYARAFLFVRRETKDEIHADRTPGFRGNWKRTQWSL